MTSPAERWRWQVTHAAFVAVTIGLGSSSARCLRVSRQATRRSEARKKKLSTAITIRLASSDIDSILPPRPLAGEALPHRQHEKRAEAEHAHDDRRIPRHAQPPMQRILEERPPQEPEPERERQVDAGPQRGELQQPEAEVEVPFRVDVHGRHRGFALGPSPAGSVSARIVSTYMRSTPIASSVVAWCGQNGNVRSSGATRSPGNSNSVTPWRRIRRMCRKSRKSMTVGKRPMWKTKKRVRVFPLTSAPPRMSSAAG